MARARAKGAPSAPAPVLAARDGQDAPRVSIEPTADGYIWTLTHNGAEILRSIGAYTDRSLVETASARALEIYLDRIARVQP